MDIEKLIDRLYTKQQSYDSYTDSELAHVMEDAITALSTLQAENAQLRAYLEYEQEHANAYYEECGQWEAENEKLKDQLYDGEGVNLVNYWMQQAKIEENGHRNCQAENEKLRAELEKVKAERDAAVSWAQKYTESIDMPCVACKHNTGDYVCTAICGNCGPMGAESCKWEFDFSGELKEG